MALPLRLLIIEDNPGDINLLRLYLNETDSRTECTFLTSGEEATRFLQDMSDDAQAPHVVVLDLNLPRVSGFEILENLRNTSYAGTPVVIFSSSGSDTDKQKAKKWGVEKYIVKPNNLDDYQSVIGQIYNIALRHSRKQSPSGEL